MNQARRPLGSASFHWGWEAWWLRAEVNAWISSRVRGHVPMQPMGKQKIPRLAVPLRVSRKYRHPQPV